MDYNKKRILLITSANLATNPRLVKEMDTLSEEYDIDVILFSFLHWSTENDVKIRNERKHIKFILLDVSKASKINWFKWGVLEKFSQFIFPIFHNWPAIASSALSRKSLKIYNYLKVNNNYQLIIAHTLPALYPAYAAATKWNIPFGFDIEDFDPGMVYLNSGSRYKDICNCLYKQLLPKAAYITSASALIEKYSLELIGGHHTHKYIINSFPQNQFLEINSAENIIQAPPILRFVWFSLGISFNRGLEEFFDAIKFWNKPLVVTLIGELDPQFENRILNPIKTLYPNISVCLLPPMPQLQLHRELSNHHIGLALENTNSELNREICLTNKIVAYAQAGNYILASNTKGQRQFIEEDSARGLICNLSRDSIIEALEQIDLNKERIIKDTFVRFNLAKKLAWENQSPIIKSLVNNIITK